MEKEKYYVCIPAGEISQVRFGNNDDFTIYATTEEVAMLRDKLNNMDNAGWGTYIRAHIPIMLYHNDKANDAYDDNLTEVFEMIYKLGDEKSRSHIEEMGILGDNHM